MQLTRKVAIGIMTVATSIGGTAALTTEATSASAAPAASCWEAYPTKGITFEGVHYWLSYDTCNHNARAASNDAKDTQDLWWHVWVYNEISKKTQAAWDSPAASANKYTDVVADPVVGGDAHACIQAYGTDSTQVEPLSGPECTNYF